MMTENFLILINEIHDFLHKAFNLVIKAFVTFETFHIFLAFIYLFFHSILSLNFKPNLRPSIFVIKAIMTFRFSISSYHLFNFNNDFLKFIFTIIWGLIKEY